MGIDGSEIKNYTKQKEIPGNQFKGSSFMVDCQACKLEGGMQAVTIARFPPFIRFIGFIIAIPSLIGMISAGVAFGASISEGGGFAYGFFGAAVLFCLSAVGGLIGWLLLMKRNVFQCGRCGFILDRA